MACLVSGMHTPYSEHAPKFVNAGVIAAHYGVTSRYILQLAAAGKIPSLRISNKCVRFDETAVAEALGAKLSAETMKP